MVDVYEDSGPITSLGLSCLRDNTADLYVAYDDYAALEAQVRYLEVYPGRCGRLEIENAALRYKLKKMEEGK